MHRILFKEIRQTQQINIKLSFIGWIRPERYRTSSFVFAFTKIRPTILLVSSILTIWTKFVFVSIHESTEYYISYAETSNGKYIRCKNKWKKGTKKKHSIGRKRKREKKTKKKWTKESKQERLFINYSFCTYTDHILLIYHSRTCQ